MIAVPTSVGYGVNFGGVAALLAMLNGCASGMAVVNIDNGYGAAHMAALINDKIENSSRTSNNGYTPAGHGARTSAGPQSGTG